MLIRHCCIGVVIVWASVARTAAAAFTPVFGGPALPSGFPQLPFTPGTSAGDGVAVANLSSNGRFRWDASGAPPVALNPLPGNPVGYSYAHGINAFGIVVGQAPGPLDDGRKVPVKLDAFGNPTKLNGLGTSVDPTDGYGAAYAINSVGLIVGSAEKRDGTQPKGYRAVRWSAGDNAITELGNLGTTTNGFTTAYAEVVNENGTAVGRAWKYVNGNVVGSPPVRWDAGSTIATELGTLGDGKGGDSQSRAYSINGAGTAVGYSYKYKSGEHVGIGAVRWDGNTTSVTELLGIGPDVASGTFSNLAQDINDSGTVVGYEQRFYPFGDITSVAAIRWAAGTTTPIALGNLGTDADTGRTHTGARGINSNGVIVGYANTYDGGTFTGAHAVAWGSDGVAFDLNLLIDPASGWLLREAYDITDTNWITGVGRFDPDGPGVAQPYDRAFLIQLPEPGNLVWIGCVSCFAQHRRRRTMRQI